MPELTKEIAALLLYLMPGLLAAWVFYGLTSHVKPSQFERVVQALIFTFLIQAILPIVQWALEFIGNWYYFRSWDRSAETISLVSIAVILGASLAYLTNKDAFHRWVRAIGFSTKSSHPSEWHAVFSESPKYVVLHMADERRLSGYTKIWPSEFDKGHFYIMQPSWLSDTGDHILLEGIDGLLINTKDVKWVEFINHLKDSNDETNSNTTKTTEQ